MTAEGRPIGGRHIPRPRDGPVRQNGHDRWVDLRPVVWDVTVVTPRADRGVTIVLRVTYRTIEQLCGEPCVETASGAMLPSYAGDATFSRFLRSSSAS